ncbi:hypothetical protein ACTHOS_13235 [Bacillus safensis]|nr:hypothetical protein [Bacillus safensis]MBU8603745.1 hypothetical protein [Bacillus safensis]MBU8614831.1 hypothetical protein [Bacillus safensis]MBU8626019.1 hypothetical protein [Bacillus safensis]MCY1096223.1 hypothetical protein [Bacillus safensis]MCY7525498.1 hypothetical protein [Bacillus safensis]
MTQFDENGKMVRQGGIMTALFNHSIFLPDNSGSFYLDVIDPMEND